MFSIMSLENYVNVNSQRCSNLLLIKEKVGKKAVKQARSADLE